MQVNTLTNTFTYTHIAYSITVVVCSEKIEMKFVSLNNKYVTSDYPATYEIMLTTAPTVLSTHCYNEEGLAFCEEIKNTELAHLFEHILIQEMALLRSKTNINVSYSGTTEWDWSIDCKGTFHVLLNAGKADLDIFESALSSTIEIFNKVVES